ncbi:hypothetical protein BDFG_07592, partial [Blastomyces dermatitidis ATCC 26199]
SSHVDRSVSADDSESDVTFLIENLKNVIMKKLSVLCVTESSVFFLTFSTTSFSAALLSVSFSATSQSSTLISVSDSLTSATSISVILTPVTSGFTVSAFVTSSLCFKKILYRLDESCFSIKDICVFRNENMNVVLFYTHRHETHTSYLRFTSVSEIILIEDDNTAETILSHSQASSITFSLSSAEKVVRTLSCK